MRGVLEAALSRHSTLTQGDWIDVSIGGQEHELLVQKTRPGTAISVIGTRSCSGTIASQHFLCEDMLGVRSLGGSGPNTRLRHCQG